MARRYGKDNTVAFFEFFNEPAQGGNMGTCKRGKRCMTKAALNTGEKIYEPFPSNTSQARIVFGRITAQQPLVLVSQI